MVSCVVPDTTTWILLEKKPLVPQLGGTFPSIFPSHFQLLPEAVGGVACA